MDYHTEKNDGGGLISKKQLLRKYGFSYGALYRWKRMGLIPDEWFIKQSTVTGQETFFPEEKICERIDLILSKKDDVTLEELAKSIRGEENGNKLLVISTGLGEKSFAAEDIRRVLIRTGNSETDITQKIVSWLKEEKQ